MKSLCTFPAILLFSVSVAMAKDNDMVKTEIGDSHSHAIIIQSRSAEKVKTTVERRPGYVKIQQNGPNSNLTIIQMSGAKSD